MDVGGRRLRLSLKTVGTEIEDVSAHLLPRPEGDLSAHGRRLAWHTLIA